MTGKEINYTGLLEELPVMPAGDHKGIEKRVVFGPGLFWDSHVARYFSVDAGEGSPFHQHDWPHFVLFLSGSGEALIMGKKHTVGEGSWAYVPSNTEHYFKNTGEKPLRFICIVPRKGDPFEVKD